MCYRGMGMRRVQPFFLGIYYLNFLISMSHISYLYLLNNVKYAVSRYAINLVLTICHITLYAQLSTATHMINVNMTRSLSQKNDAFGNMTNICVSKNDTLP